MLIQVLTTRASVFGFRHKITAINGLFSLIAHRKNFIPVILPILLQYQVCVSVADDAQPSNETMRMTLTSNVLRLLKLPTVKHLSSHHS